MSNEMTYTYLHTDRIEKSRLVDFTEYTNGLVCWGAGKVAGVAVHCLRKKGVEVIALVDIAKNKHGTKHCDIPIISQEQLLSEFPKDTPILITTTVINPVIEQLQSLGYQNILTAESLFLKIDFDGYDFWMEKEYAIRVVEQHMDGLFAVQKGEGAIGQLYTCLTSKCTLNCKECSTFIPYMQKPCHYDANDILCDLETILNSVGFIRDIVLAGGEPLMHPDLSKIISSLKEEKRIGTIHLVTNGTILPNEKCIQVLKNDNRTVVRLSDYGKLSTKLKKIKDLLEAHKIKYEITNYESWFRASKFFVTKETEEELAQKFRSCTSSHCLIYTDRKLCSCYPQYMLDMLGIMPKPNLDYVDFSQTNNNVEENIRNIVKQHGSKNYIQACKYCDGLCTIHFYDHVPVAEQAKGLLKFDPIL